MKCKLLILLIVLAFPALAAPDTQHLGFWRSVANTLPIVIPYAICTVCMVVGLRLVKTSKTTS